MSTTSGAEVLTMALTVPEASGPYLVPIWPRQTRKP